jgi:hypothetical protein
MRFCVVDQISNSLLWITKWSWRETKPIWITKELFYLVSFAGTKAPCPIIRKIITLIIRPTRYLYMLVKRLYVQKKRKKRICLWRHNAMFGDLEFIKTFVVYPISQWIATAHILQTHSLSVQPFAHQKNVNWTTSTRYLKIQSLNNTLEIRKCTSHS